MSSQLQQSTTPEYMSHSSQPWLASSRPMNLLKNQNSLFVVQKECGSEKQKIKWVVKMNDVRQLYLATYGWIETIDNFIKKCQMCYC
jgi:hypothetical protein